MAAEDKFIVALEIGSSKVTGVAGRKEPDGAIRVLAYAQEPSAAFIRKGSIFNPDKMAQCIKSIKKKLEDKLQKTISQVYVGIEGMGMHTVANSISKNFNEKRIVDNETVDEILDANRRATTPGREILDVIPQEYRLGTQSQLDPIGFYTDHIEGRFLNVAASTGICDCVRTSFEKAGVHTVETLITPLRLAGIVLTEAEKSSGCVFVDMGFGTTSVAIYKGGILRHLAVIPLGGENITHDITSLQIDDDEAEELKLAHGAAVYDEKDNEHPDLQLHDGRNVKFDEFSSIVEARVEEIVRNIDNQIKLSGYERNQLYGGIVLTGGASLLRSTERAISRFTGFEKMRFVKAIRLPMRATPSDFNKNGAYNAAIALIDGATENCCGGDPATQGNMFPTDEELKQKAEEEKRRKEEEEQKKREADAEAARIAEEKAREEEERRHQEELKNQKLEKRRQWWQRIKSTLTGFVSEDDETAMLSGKNDKKN